MEDREDISRLKRDYRKKLKRIRDNLSREQYVRFNQAIFKNLNKLAAFQSATRIFTYISNGAEADTHALIRARSDDLDVLAVPKLDNTTMLAVKFPGWEELAVDPLGILTPPSNERCSARYDAVITPGLGFTRQGVRLGYGRGYYDRWFAAHPPTVKIALCYAVQLVNRLPHDDHDMPIDIIVTEREIIRIDRG